MTLGQLKAMIEDAYAEGADDNTTVLMATQPHYPLQSRVQGVKVTHTAAEDIEEVSRCISKGGLTDDERAEAHEELDRLEDANEIVVYILEGGQCDHPYASRDLWS